MDLMIGIRVYKILMLFKVFARANHFMPRQRPGEYEYQYKIRLSQVFFIKKIKLISDQLVINSCVKYDFITILKE